MGSHQSARIIVTHSVMTALLWPANFSPSIRTNSRITGMTERIADIDFYFYVWYYAMFKGDMLQS